MDRWGDSAPTWYWVDPMPVLPLPGPKTPAPWGRGLPELYGHEPRELRLFWERSAVQVVREAAGRYRWVELAESPDPRTGRPGWWGRVLSWTRRLRGTRDADATRFEGWQTVEVSRRRQPVLLRVEPAGDTTFEIIQYMKANRPLFWRLGWGANRSKVVHTSEPQVPGGALQAIGRGAGDER